MTTKTILITGATRGTGLKLAELYSKLGWKVIGTARNPSMVDQFRALSPYKIVQLDSANEAPILRAAKELEGEAIHLLINNAGMLAGGSLAETTKEDLVKQFEVNRVRPFLVTRAFVPHLKAGVAMNGAANVVQMSSCMGNIELNNGTFLGYYGYHASKTALNTITVSLALDLKADGIAVFMSHPGIVPTEMNGHTGEISTDTGANGMIKVIGNLTIADTGKFYDYNGASVPW